MVLWDQSPGDKEVVVAYDGDSCLHTFLLDLDNVAGASVPALGTSKLEKVMVVSVFCKNKIVNLHCFMSEDYKGR